MAPVVGFIQYNRFAERFFFRALFFACSVELNSGAFGSIFVFTVIPLLFYRQAAKGTIGHCNRIYKSIQCGFRITDLVTFGKLLYLQCIDYAFGKPGKGIGPVVVLAQFYGFQHVFAGHYLNFNGFPIFFRNILPGFGYFQAVKFLILAGVARRNPTVSTDAAATRGVVACNNQLSAFFRQMFHAVRDGCL